MSRVLCVAELAVLLRCSMAAAAEPPMAENRFEVDLPEHQLAGDLLPDSPLGINMVLRPDAPDMQRPLTGSVGPQTIGETSRRHWLGPQEESRGRRRTRRNGPSRPRPDPRRPG